MAAATMVHFVATPAVGPVVERGEVVELTKAAPYFQALDTEVVELFVEHVHVEGLAVEVRHQRVDREVAVIEARWLLDDVVSDVAVARREAVQRWLRARAGVGSEPDAMFEEYVVVCVAPATSPDAFVAEHAYALANLIRREARAVSREEAAQILTSRVRYSDDDLAIVDWDGALVIDNSADFTSDLALLKLGNTQLMQYRMLDRRINERLGALRGQLAHGQRLTSQRRTMRAVLQTRLDLLLHYEAVEQLLALIGDWYTAELYRVIIDEFYVDEWKAAVHAKLDELHAIADSAGANLAFTWQQLLDLVQLAGWALLLVGYFVLFWFEARR